MSQVKLILRPPPNVDFVHGYPGIPPGTDRQQACVKGAIEVRTGPQGVKAKWVRVELRKVETLPGGGIPNTFYDFVGPSPVTLWTASDEYGLLRSQDIPFQIRIPESVPPSIALESGAGIKYELLASVCTKGKRGFLRRRKSSVISTQASIIIDKHELHSTWPVYSQQETRQITNEGVTLTVDRNQTCFGPGDRISVMATLRSDSTNTVLLRGFELTLKESTIFRAGPYTSGKKSVPQVRVVTVDENKVPVNFNLYGGMVQKAELTCGVSPNHTTTSLNTARHIDITYVLSVKALLGTGPLVMDLPIVLSNWQRVVSHEAIRRIGAVPSLSLTPPGGTGGVPQNTLPSRVEPAPGRSRPNEVQGSEFNRPNTANDDSYSQPGRVTSPRAEDPRNTSLAGRTPSASATNTASNRFTITNALESELTPSPDRENRETRRGPSASGSGNNNRAWPSAEEEKLKLYNQAIDKAQKMQGQVIGSSAAQETTTPTTAANSPSARSARNGPWPTAEEEKLKLWNKAQNAVKQTQANAISAAEQQRRSPPISKSADLATPVTSKTSQYPSAEQEKEQLRRYQEAVSAVERTQNAPLDAGGSSSTPPFQSPSPAIDLPPPFEAAAASPPVDARMQLAEKERMRRHFEAQDAAAAQHPASSPVDARTQLAEKERLRRHFEVQDAAATAQQQPAFNDPSMLTAKQEKEMIRRKLAEQDAQAVVMRAQPTTPPRAASPPHNSHRPTPSPPSASGSRPLTAAEEKAMLRARYESENSAHPPTTNGYTNGIHNAPLSPAYSYKVTPPTSPSPPVTSPEVPPPLMPRPPADYIKETQEEDARVSKYVMNGTVPNFEDYPSIPSPPPRRPSP
ncbi:hypothetical protein L218DRAFT_954446 [Marasmius fiardii PR-910]|nr:hypothetical protein L218DRAFT_954446 [Marasmius fiardii PR-910]